MKHKTPPDNSGGKRRRDSAAPPHRPPHSKPSSRSRVTERKEGKAPRWQRDDAPPRRERFGKDTGTSRPNPNHHRRDDRPPPRAPRWQRDDAPPRRERFGKDTGAPRPNHHRRDDRPPPRTPRWQRDDAPPRRERFGKDAGAPRPNHHRRDERPPPRTPRWQRDDAPPRRERFGKDTGAPRPNHHRRDDRPPPRTPHWQRDDAPPRTPHQQRDDARPHSDNDRLPQYQFSKSGRPVRRIERWQQGDSSPRQQRDRPFAAAQQPTSPAANSEKVQKILADSGMGSRRQMEVWLQEGRVQVNGESVSIGARAAAADRITVDGKVIPQAAQQHRLLLYYKPVGKVVSQAEEDGDSVFNDLPQATGGRWINLGRLDINSEGLLLFCTDGAWVQAMTHPKHGMEREYRVRASGTLSSETLSAACRDGIALAGTRPLRPCRFVLEREGEGLNCWYRIVLSEGRNRAVRRIFEHYNLQVSRLLRVRFGIYTLPSDLAPGDWRELPAPTPCTAG